MGRLRVEIHHGHDGGPAAWGAVAALIVLVLFAAAGHKEIGVMLHEVLTVVEIAALTIAGSGVLAVAGFVMIRRRAARRDRARRAAVIPVAPDYRVRVEPGDTARPALGSPARRASGWPLPGQWDEITPPDGDGRRCS